MFLLWVYGSTLVFILKAHFPHWHVEAESALVSGPFQITMEYRGAEQVVTCTPKVPHIQQFLPSILMKVCIHRTMHGRMEITPINLFLRQASPVINSTDSAHQQRCVKNRAGSVTGSQGGGLGA